MMQGFTRIMRALLTRSRSQYAALIIFSGMGLADFLFRTHIFPVYTYTLQKIGAKTEGSRV